jgi:hypothetical protein
MVPVDSGLLLDIYPTQFQTIILLLHVKNQSTHLHTWWTAGKRECIYSIPTCPSWCPICFTFGGKIKTHTGSLSWELYLQGICRVFFFQHMYMYFYKESEHELFFRILSVGSSLLSHLGQSHYVCMVFFFFFSRNMWLFSIPCHTSLSCPPSLNPSIFPD